MRSRDDRPRHVGARRGDRRATGGREPGRRRRAVGPARDDGRGRGRKGAVGDLSQRPLVRLGDRRPGPAVMVDVAFGGAFYAVPRGAGSARGAAAADRARAGAEARARGGARDRAPPRARVARRLRRHLLAARGRSTVHAAERDRVRGRRGGPLAVRLRDLGTTRAARRVGPAAARRGAPPSLDRRLRVRRTRRRGGEVAGRRALVTEVTGSAYRTGESSFTLDPDDPLGEGFLLR